jgi:glycosyltransferase involved in cell wall biosynthesis
MKKRILLCNEASYLSTGFSTYGLEVLKRLHATGKYVLAEYASYGPWGDDRALELPWGYYTAMPDPRDDGEVNEYNGKPTNQFGEWKFERVCLDFQPDIVWDIRDWWMLEYQERSPFRPCYHWAVMPTVDAAPQDEAWLATFAGADGVFSYSDWGLDVLDRQGGGRIRTVASAPPGADIETLRPAGDKRAHKRQMGLPEDCLVVGTIMRNQKRKLYPDLIASFARLLAAAPPELARRTYLYLHVSYPDAGWDIPRLLKEHGVGSRTLVTYHCSSCGVSFPSFYTDARAYCRRCGNNAANLPSTNLGVPRNVLANVLNFMDCYVQYANSEGFGMPQVEAAACGVPTFAVDYSAMSDIVRKLKGTPVAVKALVRECETGCDRAVPDNDDLVAKLIAFLSLPEGVRLRKGFEARRAVERHYTYDRTARVWEDYFDGLPGPVRTRTWGSPPRLHTPPPGMPAGLSDEEFVRWGITNIAGRPDLADGYLALRMARDLAWGATLGSVPRSVFNELALLGTHYRPAKFDRERAGQELMAMCRHRNFWEEQRAGTPLAAPL